MMMNDKFKKFLIEALRWGVFVFVSGVLQFIIENLGGLELDPNFVIILTSVLRFVDAGLHKSGIAVKGIARF